MKISFTSQPIWWQGPAPFLFIPVPAAQSRAIKEMAAAVSYGWGCIPVRVWIGKVSWTTSLIPKEGVYLVPIKKAISQAAGISMVGAYDLALELGKPH